jgi:hypothetical protein
MSPEIAHEPTSGEHARHEEHAEQQGLAPFVVSREAHHRHQSPEHDEHQRDHPVKAPGLRVRPGVERPDDLAPVVGVGAAILHRAPVADMGSSPIAHEPALVIELVAQEMLALRARPVILTGVVGEARGAVPEGTAVGVR